MLTSAIQISQCIRIRRVWFRAEIACYIYVYMFKTNENDAAKLQLRGGQYNLAVAKKAESYNLWSGSAVQFSTELQKSEKLQLAEWVGTILNLTTKSEKSQLVE